MEDSHENWKAWFTQHGAKLLLYARQWTRSVADAEDLVQEAFVRFWRRQRHLDGEPVGLVLTSLRRAALDRARHEQRRRLREASAEISPAEEGPLFQRLDEDDDRRVAIEAALGRLPAEQRQVLVMKIWAEQTFEQIGQHLGISPNTAASRYRYALSTLRKELSPTPAHG